MGDTSPNHNCNSCYRNPTFGVLFEYLGTWDSWGLLGSETSRGALSSCAPQAMRACFCSVSGLMGLSEFYKGLGFPGP